MDLYDRLKPLDRDTRERVLKLVKQLDFEARQRDRKKAQEAYEELLKIPGFEKVFSDAYANAVFFNLEWYLLWKKNRGRNIPRPYDRRFWPPLRDTDTSAQKGARHTQNE